MNISLGEGARSLAFLWLGNGKDDGGEMPFQVPWNPAEEPSLGALGVEAASRENL